MSAFEECKGPITSEAYDKFYGEKKKSYSMPEVVGSKIMLRVNSKCCTYIYKGLCILPNIFLSYIFMCSCFVFIIIFENYIQLNSLVWVSWNINIFPTNTNQTEDNLLSQTEKNC